MAQLTIRLDDHLATQLKAHAAALGRSLNSWVIAVLSAAIDPEFADSEAERTRARLARAGLLASPVPQQRASPPDPERLRQARRAAGAGTPLSDLVSDGRD